MSSKETHEVVEDVRADTNVNGQDLEKVTTIDTIHNDEATRVLAAYDGDETWTDEEERKVLKKIDRRLLWLLILTYGLQYYDKSMLSQAVSSELI